METLAQLRRGELAGITRLDLSCKLERFPEEIYDLADTLEVLNLSGNALTSLPDDLLRLHRLRVVFCSDNLFTHVPEVLGECPLLDMVGFKANRITHLPAASLPPQLRWLILTDNQLGELPAELGDRSHLQKLMLAGNRLHHLPEQMQALTRLELLRISANRFETLPEWLLTLPRLAWLAFAGNPVSDAFEAPAVARQVISDIDWGELALQHRLGEGASGVIHQASWQTAERVTPVAVKMFKGAVTSDGLPCSEKAACLAAGAHPNLIGIAGRVSRHPEDAKGLVMSLIAPEFKNLAAPPSLTSCTRDVYPAATRFTLNVVLTMAKGIAAAAAQLHERCIMHGDLYAHNILWNGQGDCLLGDFGAASFVPLNDERQAQALQRIEVRAYACLLEELLQRCEYSPAAQHTVDKLWELQRSCASTIAGERPLFPEVCRILAALW